MRTSAVPPCSEPVFNPEFVLNGSGYKVRAEVDYLDVDLHLHSPTHPWHVIPFFGPSAGFVRMKELPGNVASELTVRIQNPGSVRSVILSIHRLTQKYPLTAPVRFSKIEVAFDVYRSGADTSELGEVAAKLYRHCSLKPSENCRLATVGKTMAIPDYPSFVSAMRSGTYSCYVGSQDVYRGKAADPVSMRFYPKTTDCRRPLPQDTWRARMEVTLQDTAMPFHSLEEAAADFAEMEQPFRLKLNAVLKYAALV